MDEATAATVFSNLTSEVEVPENGTLSRVLYKDDRLRVVLFAFDAGQELTDHATPSAAVIQILTGRLRLGFGDEAIEAGPGAWVHMPPNMRHSVKAVEPSIMLLSMLRAA